MDHLLAVLAGCLVIMSMSLNSALGRRIGVFPGTAVNYLAGLLGAALIVAATGSWRVFSLAGVPGISLAGGVLGVIVVSASNVVLPRIPVVSVTALLFVGQMAAGLVIDGLARGAPDLPRLSGAVLVLAGLLVNLAIDRRTAARARTGTPPSAA